MNVQADMSGHVSSQSAAQLPGVSQQNGNVVPNIVAAGGGAPHAAFIADPELIRTRSYMHDKIFLLLAQRHQQPINESQMQKLKDIVKRLEEGLFKSALSKEEYVNLDTLESRLHGLIKRPSLNRNPVTANSMTTMIPTPGLSHNGSSTMMATSSVDASISNMGGSSSMQPTNANTGSHMSSGVMQSSPFNRTDGLLSNGYQHAQANYSIGSGGNNLSQMGMQRMSSQMIPTPGFSNSSGNHSYGSLEASNNGGRMSIVDSPMVSQDQHQKLHVSNQNSRVLHALGSQTGGAIRSGIQQKSYGFSNGALNGGLGMIGSNLQMSNGPSTSEGFLNASPYINSSKPLQHQFDQYQRSSVQGDVFGSSTDVSGPGNLYTAGTSTGPMANSQSMGTLNLQSLTKTKASLVANPSNLHSTQQAAHLKPQSVDPVEKMNFQSALPSREKFIQSQHQQQFQQQTHYQPH